MITKHQAEGAIFQRSRGKGGTLIEPTPCTILQVEKQVRPSVSPRKWTSVGITGEALTLQSSPPPNPDSSLAPSQSFAMMDDEAWD